MKRLIAAVLACILAASLLGCSRSQEPAVLRTFEATPLELSKEYAEEGQEIVFQTYCEMTDGTWTTDGRTYQDRLVIKGRLRGAVRDVAYTILSNIGDITFEQAWKASGLSSNMADYFDVEDLTFVGIQ
ncbi:MAG: immunogenic protein [Oscillospiraceae bacterium]|nr:immunogenic protein [Oscillospiraceae bacterium]